MLLEKEYGNLDSLGIDISQQDRRKVEQTNSNVNNNVLNLTMPDKKDEEPQLHAKIGWRIIVPIATAVAGGIIVTVVIKCFGL